MTRVDVCPTQSCRFVAKKNGTSSGEWTRDLYELGVADCPKHGRWFWILGTERGRKK